MASPWHANAPRAVDDVSGDGLSIDWAGSTDAAKLAHNGGDDAVFQIADRLRTRVQRVTKRKVFEQIADRTDAELRELLSAVRTDAADELHISIERNTTVHRAQSMTGGTTHSTRVIRDPCGREKLCPRPVDLRNDEPLADANLVRIA